MNFESCYCYLWVCVCVSVYLCVPLNRLSRLSQHLIMAVFYIHWASLLPSTLCILEHEGLTVQSSHSSPFMLTLTGLPCPPADLFIGSVLSLRLLLFSRHTSNASSLFSSRVPAFLPLPLADVICGTCIMTHTCSATDRKVYCFG